MAITVLVWFWFRTRWPLKQNKKEMFFITFIIILLFYIIIAYFVIERIGLSIGIYISIKCLMSESSEKMVETSKFVSQKQNKNWRQTIKTITNEFECFGVRPLHCNFYFFLQQKNNKSCVALVYRITSCSINHRLPSF